MNHSVRKFIPVLEKIKIPDGKAAVDKWDKFEKTRARQPTRARNKRGDQ